MFVPSTMRSSFGRVIGPVRPPVRMRLTRHEVHLLAIQIAREADMARAEGRYDLASRLDWRAADLKEAAR